MMPKTDGPEEPLTLLMEGAAQLYELFMAFMAAGFTEVQAMQLVCSVIQGSMRKE